MAAVGRDAQHHIVQGGADGAVQHRFKRLVTGIVGGKRQIVAKQHKAFRALVQRFDDGGKVDEFLLVHFDQAQTLASVFIQQVLICSAIGLSIL